MAQVQCNASGAKVMSNSVITESNWQTIAHCFTLVHCLTVLKWEKHFKSENASTCQK